MKSFIWSFCVWANLDVYFFVIISKQMCKMSTYYHDYDQSDNQAEKEATGNDVSSEPETDEGKNHQ